MVAGSVRLIDLSVPLEDNAVSEPRPPRIKYMRHDRGGFAWMRKRFGIKRKDLMYSHGLGGVFETFHGITHTGTHLDAPWHFSPTSEGRPSKTIDQIPLEWCFGDGVVLDLRHKLPGDFITVADLEQATARIGYEIKPFDIVLIMTGCDKKMATAAYFDQPGMSREGTLWLLDKGVKVAGIDAYGFDRKFADMAADYQRTGDGRYVWPAHFAGITKEYCHIEKLANLDQIPRPFGFKVAVFPIKIKNASAGWTRAVAIVEEPAVV